MRTANPALNKNAFAHMPKHSGESMTVNGAINKSFILFLLLLFPAIYIWNMILSSSEVPSYFNGLLIGSIILGLVVAIITIFKKEWSPITAPIYAIVEGVILGAISVFFNIIFPGIVLQAVALTFGVLLVMLFLYRTHIIKVTQKFRMAIVAATGAIFLVYIISFIMSFFGTTIPLIHGSGMVGIGFSLVVVAIAALNLVLDFDFFERGAQANAPKYMEWYAAFGLMVTLIWLYIEILRLLSKLRSRN
ncbi:MAG: Bax inhibitor-1/YccA family protein [Nanoarchaeota archaeon]